MAAFRPEEESATAAPARIGPLPGSPVRGSRSGAPVMALLDLLGRRWAMGVLWTLCEGGPATFSPDGSKLAYNIISREWRTWKRYTAGRAQDVYVYDLTGNRVELIHGPGTRWAVISYGENGELDGVEFDAGLNMDIRSDTPLGGPIPFAEPPAGEER